MPLLYFDVIDGRDPGEIKALLDASHAAMVEAFGVPERASPDGSCADKCGVVTL